MIVHLFRLLTLVFMIFLSSCASMRFRNEVEIPASYKELFSYRGATLYGGSGLSISDPIIIKGAKSTFYGIEAEKRFLDKNYPGHILSNQYLFEGKKRDRTLDCIEIFVSGGQKKKIYFDITEFYGK